jgi:hypothetical protein
VTPTTNVRINAQNIAINSNFFLIVFPLFRCSIGYDERTGQLVSFISKFLSIVNFLNRDSFISIMLLSKFISEK